MEPTDQPTTSTSRVAGDAGSVRRGRPSRILAATVLSELVVLAAACNQSIVHRVQKNLDTRSYADYTRGALEALITFGWRFAPSSGQATHAWAAQLAAIGTLVVLSVLGVLAVARGVVTFGRVFVAVWAVVAAVAPIAIMVRNVLLVPSAPGPQRSRIGQSVYGFTDFGAVIVAGLALGLVTGLVTALIAVATRTKPEAAEDYRSRGGEDGEYLYSGELSARGDQPTTSYQPPPWGEEPTGVQPRSYAPAGEAPAWNAPAGPPAWDAPAGPPWAGSSSTATEETQQFTAEPQDTTRLSHPDSETQQFGAARPVPLDQEDALDHDPSDEAPQWPSAPPPSGPPGPSQSLQPPEPQQSAPTEEEDATAQLPAVTDDDGQHSR